MGAGNKRVYDIKEYSEKAKAAIALLKQEQKPGEAVGKGSKTEVLLAVKAEILEVMRSGYSTKQIADALHQHNVFGILPKTITQLFAAAHKTRTARRTAQPATKKQAQVEHPSNKKRTSVIVRSVPNSVSPKRVALEEAATFKIKDDTDEL